MELFCPLCLSIVVHFGHIWPPMSNYCPLWSSLAAIGTTIWDQQVPKGDCMGPLFGYKGASRALNQPYRVSMSQRGPLGTMLGHWWPYLAHVDPQGAEMGPKCCQICPCRVSYRKKVYNSGPLGTNMCPKWTMGGPNGA